MLPGLLDGRVVVGATRLVVSGQRVLTWQSEVVIMSEYMGQAVLDVELVPSRVAYLIRPGSRDGFHRSVQEACTRWGGQTEPILPVDDDGVVADEWREVVRLADVEVVVNVDVDEDAAAAAAAAVGCSLVDLAEISTFGAPSSWTMHPSSIDAGQPLDQAYVIAAEAAPLWHVAVAGDLTPADFLSLQAPVVSFRGRVSFPVQRVRAEDQIARSPFHGWSLVDRTVLYFGECWTSSSPSGFPALVWLTEGDDVADCVTFWNMRALRPLRFSTVPMILLPSTGLEHWLHYAEEFAATLARPEGFHPDVVIGSHTVDEDGLRRVAEQLHLLPGTDEIRSGRRLPMITRDAPFTYFTGGDMARMGRDYRQWLGFGRRYGEPAQAPTQLFRASTRIRFPSPVPFLGGSCLMRVSGGPFGTVPPRASTAALIHDHATWHGAALQVATDVGPEYDLEVRIPRMNDVVDAVIGEAVTKHHLSDKGKIGAALQSSRDITVLLQPDAYEAVIELTTPRAKRLRHALQAASTDLDATMVDRLVAEWGHRGERRYRAGSQFRPSSRAALETLVESQWVERGFEIACTRCGVRTFVPMHDVPTRGPAACPGCHASQHFTVVDGLPAVYYRLDALVDRASDQGVLPHLLVVDVLTERDPDCLLLPGVDLVFADGSTLEVDIVGVHQARVLGGEVKTQAADFTAGQLARDVELSRRLRADIHLLAALDTVPPEIEAAAGQLCRENGLELIVLDHAELRPASSTP